MGVGGRKGKTEVGEVSGLCEGSETRERVEMTGIRRNLNPKVTRKPSISFSTPRSLLCPPTLSALQSARFINACWIAISYNNPIALSFQGNRYGLLKHTHHYRQTHTHRHTHTSNSFSKSKTRELFAVHVFFEKFIEVLLILFPIYFLIKKLTTDMSL